MLKLNCPEGISVILISDHIPLSLYKPLCWSLFWYALCPFCNRLDEEERVGYFALIVFLMSCYCLLVTVSWIGPQSLIVVIPEQSHFHFALLEVQRNRILKKKSTLCCFTLLLQGTVIHSPFLLILRKFHCFLHIFQTTHLNLIAYIEYWNRSLNTNKSQLFDQTN